MTLVQIFIACALILPLTCAAEGHGTYLVVGVSDGDTIKVLDAGLRNTTCRLYGIDAPEKRQAFGQVSKISLAELVYGRRVSIDVTGRDRYKRAICRITLGGVDINKQQIARGMAWMYRQYSADAAYEAAEREAQLSRRGLWVEDNPTAPWDFRRGLLGRRTHDGAHDQARSQNQR